MTIIAFIAIAHNPLPLSLNQSLNRGRYKSQFEMQGLQTIKCTSCGTIFMSETDIVTCPSCSEQSYEHGTDSTMSSCGCGIDYLYLLLIFQ